MRIGYAGFNPRAGPRFAKGRSEKGALWEALHRCRQRPSCPTIRSGAGVRPTPQRRRPCGLAPRSLGPLAEAAHRIHDRVGAIANRFSEPAGIHRHHVAGRTFGVPHLWRARGVRAQSHPRADQSRRRRRQGKRQEGRPTPELNSGPAGPRDRPLSTKAPGERDLYHVPDLQAVGVGG
jgi:hypothetical protein